MRRYTVLIIVGGVVLLAGATVFFIRSTAEAAWDAMSRRTQELIIEAGLRPSPRSVLRGAPVPGNAWTDYEIAIDEVKKVGRDLQAVRRFAMGNEKDPRSVIDPESRNFARAIEAMRRGTQRAEGADASRWTSDVEIRARPTMEYSSVAAVAVLKARQDFEAGLHRDSVELLLDVLQYAGDIQRRSTLYFYGTGSSITEYPLNSLRKILPTGKFTSEELKEFDRQLELIERDLPDVQVNLRNEAIVQRVEMITGGPEAWSVQQFSTWGLWRYGFSNRLAAVDAVGWNDHFRERVAAMDSLPYLEFQVALDAFVRDVEKCPNVLARGLYPIPRLQALTGRTNLSQLRLLRAAVRYLLSGQFIELPDPFGTVIQHAEAAGKVTFWSLGLDGFDQGGTGHWEPNMYGGDMILEVPK